MQRRSAGLLMYRRSHGELEVLLVHPGGPFYINKDKGAWAIPKGEYLEPEPALEAAMREFNEETGFSPNGPYLELGTIRQKGGKLVSAWAFEGDCDPAQLVSNTCLIDWPPRSGRQMEIPEVDRCEWFSIDRAEAHIVPSQAPLLDALVNALRELG